MAELPSKRNAPMAVQSSTKRDVPMAEPYKWRDAPIAEPDSRREWPNG